MCTLLKASIGTYYNRVEVCANNIWGTICSDFWDYEDASVFCGQLGHSRYGMLLLYFQLYNSYIQVPYLHQVITLTTSYHLISLI